MLVAPAAEDDAQTVFHQFWFQGKINFVEFQSYSLSGLLIRIPLHEGLLLGVLSIDC